MNEAVPVENIKKAIEEMRVLQKQEDKGVAYYYPPFYCERCINILMKECKIEEEEE